MVDRAFKTNYFFGPVHRDITATVDRAFKTDYFSLSATGSASHLPLAYTEIVCANPFATAYTWFSALVMMMMIMMMMRKIIIIIRSFYTALYSALEQTHCAHVACDSE